MAEGKRDELLEQGYKVVVKDSTAHATAGDCWSEKDWLIPLADFEDAEAHGYEICKKCDGSTSGRVATRPTATSE